MKAEEEAFIAKYREVEGSQSTRVTHATSLKVLRPRQQYVVKEKSLRTEPVPANSKT